MSITFENKHKGYSINTNKEKNQGCDTNILDKSRIILKHITQKHNKVLCARMDLTYPEGYFPPKDNNHISEFTSKFIKHFKRNGYDPHYLWVREQSKDKRQHYHLMIAVDGNKMQFPNKLYKTAEKHWESTIGADSNGLVDWCNRHPAKSQDNSETQKTEKGKNSYRLRRNDPNFEDEFDACHKRVSYLASQP